MTPDEIKTATRRIRRQQATCDAPHIIKKLEHRARKIFRDAGGKENYERPPVMIHGKQVSGGWSMFYLPDDAPERAWTARGLLLEAYSLRSCRDADYSAYLHLKIGAMAQQLEMANLIQFGRTYLDGKRRAGKKGNDAKKQKAGALAAMIRREASRLRNVHGSLRGVQMKVYHQQIADACGCSIRTVRTTLSQQNKTAAKR